MKMFRIAINIVFVMLTLSVMAQSSQWNFDRSHTSVTFTVEHMVISEVPGVFEKFDGTVLSEKEDFSDSKINFLIDASSINTNNAKRDDHLRGADFFDVGKYPQIKFESTSFEKITGNKYLLKGDFTMHGVTKEISLDVIYRGTMKDPYGKTRAGFKLTGEINRKDFGLKWNSVMESGALVVSEEVKIECNVELIKQ